MTNESTVTTQFDAGELRRLADRMGPLDVVTVTASERIAANACYAGPLAAAAPATVRTTALPLCALCYGFYSENDPCCGAGIARDAQHVTDWNGEAIVRQFDANPLDGPDYIDLARRRHLIACVGDENS
jgi:hypothetical protein